MMTRHGSSSLFFSFLRPDTIFQEQHEFLAVRRGD
jgi:hypothetical protein